MPKVYCKNCKHNNVWGSSLYWYMKLLSPFCMYGDVINACYKNLKIKHTYSGDKITDKDVYSKDTFNHNGECEYYKRKWWKFWIMEK